ncbi:MAG: hypothetical protein QOD06_734, partial [Candidatus Binatota bacterium]|nr:hypothetical protein [Candidatus Binatota bacterium]
KFLGETRIGKPGPFLVEVDPNDSAVTIYAFRGAIGAIEECATATVDGASGASRKLTLEMKGGPCPVPINRQ